MDGRTDPIYRTLLAETGAPKNKNNVDVGYMNNLLTSLVLLFTTSTVSMIIYQAIIRLD